MNLHFACGSNVQDFKVGDEVGGVTFFGGYSTHVAVPQAQLLHRPQRLSASDFCALPTVSCTAFHALKLAGLIEEKGKRALVHSAAGGVGCALVQLLKHYNHEVTGVVGNESKCQTVLDSGGEACVKGKLPVALYDAIFDANGVETLQWSYDHLKQNGRLIVYGFHTNLPQRARLGPMQWLSMMFRLLKTPRFDPMDLTVRSKSVMGFNLSFFADETIVIADYMRVLTTLIAKGVVRIPTCVLSMTEVSAAHEFLSSGKTIGKLVIKVYES